MTEKLHTIGDAAEYFKVHEQTIRGWMRKGLLTGFKAGKDWRFTDKDFADCVERLREQTNSNKAKASPKKQKATSAKHATQEVTVER